MAHFIQSSSAFSSAMSSAYAATAGQSRFHNISGLTASHAMPLSTKPVQSTSINYETPRIQLSKQDFSYLNQTADMIQKNLSSKR